MLKFEGYTCLPAHDAGQALDLLGSGQIPDLMIIDVRLPGLSGPELALRIHASHPRIPVLFVSGWVSGLVDPDRLSPLRWDFLPKPFMADVLVDRMQRLLERSQAA
jgi:DNA-binding response OmpR family regulator